jgi:O-antigen/teichoic acid export membrane protein
MIQESLRSFFEHASFKRLFKNTGLLLGGDTVSAVLGVLTFAVSARALGTENLGMLVLIDAYVRIVDKVMNFQSWQFMIKFGSDAIEHGDAPGFKALVKLGTLVDAITATIACAVSLALAGAVGRWQNWSGEMVTYALIYSSIIIFDVAGVPTGILRIFDRFKLFSVQKSVCSSIKFFGALAAWFFGCGLKGFLWVWMVTEIFDYVSLTVMAWVELRRRGYTGIWSEPLKGVTRRYPGLWGFLISTNLTGSVKVGFRELDILLVGKLLNFTDVGLYKLAKKLCAALDRLTNPLFQSLYPELTKIWARRDVTDFKHVVRKMIYIMGAVSVATWFVFFFWGRTFIDWMAGPEFAAAYPVTLWYLLANVIAVSALPLAPMILAMGMANLSFWIQFLPTLVYFPVLYWMISTWGLVGAGYAYLVYHGLRLVYQYGVVKRIFYNLTKRGNPAGSAVTGVGSPETPADFVARQ